MKANGSHSSFDQCSALSSVVEHFLHTEGAAGSNPAARTIYRSDTSPFSRLKGDDPQGEFEIAMQFECKFEQVRGAKDVEIPFQLINRF